MDFQELNNQKDTSSYECFDEPDKIDEFNFVEVSRLPKNINARSLASLIAKGTQTVPKSVEVCFKDDGTLNQIGLVEYKSAQEAHRSVTRAMKSVYTNSWRYKIISNPKYTNPDEELKKKWLS